MGRESRIEWTDHTWSPWWGCSKVSRGCKHCYAESLSKRMGFQIWGQDAERKHLSSKHWEQPFRWSEEAGRLGIQYKVFPSMCDPFEARADLDPLRRRFFELIRYTPNLQWLLVTKRPEQLIEYPGLPPNAHLLATVEGNTVKNRIFNLRQYRNYGESRILGLSIEPLTEPLDLSLSDLRGIDWAIVGGETGHHSERMLGRWVQSIFIATRKANTRFLFKQWGDAALLEDIRLFSHLERVREFPALLGPAVTKR